MPDGYLISLIESQGLQNMPPVVRTLVERLLDALEQAQELDKVHEQNSAAVQKLAKQADELADRIRDSGEQTDKGVLLTYEEHDELRSRSLALVSDIEEFDVTYHDSLIFSN